MTPKLRLVNNWRQLWWRRFSTWLAALNGIFVGYVFSQPILVVGLIGFAPDGWTVPLAAAAGLLAFALPVVVAHVAQPRTMAKIEEKQHGDA